MKQNNLAGHMTLVPSHQGGSKQVVEGCARIQRVPRLALPQKSPENTPLTISQTIPQKKRSRSLTGIISLDVILGLEMPRVSSWVLF